MSGSRSSTSAPLRCVCCWRENSKKDLVLSHCSSLCLLCKSCQRREHGGLCRGCRKPVKSEAQLPYGLASSDFLVPQEVWMARIKIVALWQQAQECRYRRMLENKLKSLLMERKLRSSPGLPLSSKSLREEEKDDRLKSSAMGGERRQKELRKNEDRRAKGEGKEPDYRRQERAQGERKRGREEEEVLMIDRKPNPEQERGSRLSFARKLLPSSFPSSAASDVSVGVEGKKEMVILNALKGKLEERKAKQDPAKSTRSRRGGGEQKKLSTKNVCAKGNNARAMRENQEKRRNNVQSRPVTSNLAPLSMSPSPSPSPIMQSPGFSGSLLESPKPRRRREEGGQRAGEKARAQKIPSFSGQENQGRHTRYSRKNSGREKGKEGRTDNDKDTKCVNSAKRQVSKSRRFSGDKGFLSGFRFHSRHGGKKRKQLSHERKRKDESSSGKKRQVCFPGSKSAFLGEVKNKDRRRDLAKRKKAKHGGLESGAENMKFLMLGLSNSTSLAPAGVPKSEPSLNLMSPILARLKGTSLENCPLPNMWRKPAKKGELEKPKKMDLFQGRR